MQTRVSSLLCTGVGPGDVFPSIVSPSEGYPMAQPLPTVPCVPLQGTTWNLCHVVANCKDHQTQCFPRNESRPCTSLQQESDLPGDATHDPFSVTFGPSQVNLMFPWQPGKASHGPQLPSTDLGFLAEISVPSTDLGCWAPALVAKHDFGCYARTSVATHDFGCCARLWWLYTQLGCEAQLWLHGCGC